MPVYRLTNFLLALALSASGVAEAADSCDDTLGASPTSSAARACAAQELEKEQKELRRLEIKIEKALSGETGLGLTKKSFQKAQRDWKAYRGSTCWLEAAFVAEPTATQPACEARMTSCRARILAKLLVDVTDGGGGFSATGTCE